MKYQSLDTVVLLRDLPNHSLRVGDLGAIVEIYEPDGLEVEFVTASGRIGALVALKTEDVRPIVDTNLVTMRSLARSAWMPAPPLVNWLLRSASLPVVGSRGLKLVSLACSGHLTIQPKPKTVHAVE